MADGRAFSSPHSSPRCPTILSLCQCLRPGSCHHLSPQRNPREDPLSFLALEQVLKPMDPPRPPRPAAPGVSPAAGREAAWFAGTGISLSHLLPARELPENPSSPTLFPILWNPTKKKNPNLFSSQPLRDLCTRSNPLKLPSVLLSSMAPSWPQPTAGSREGSSWVPASSPTGLCQTGGLLRRQGWGTTGFCE